MEFGFQSLFYWILVLDYLFIKLIMPYTTVSILVLLDFGFRLKDKMIKDDEAIKFQSLFYWILVLDIIKSSFN